MPKNPFGGGGFKGYKPSGDEWKQSNQMLRDRVGGMIKGIPNPKDMAFGNRAPNLGVGGKSSWGFGNKTFTSPYQKYGFTAPDLTGKKSAFSTILGQAGNQFSRQSRASSDAAMRNMMKSGTYNPAAMNKVLLDSQTKAQEGIESMGTKGAYDIASEQAKYDFEKQLQDARQGELAKEFEQKGGQLALAGEELAQKGKTAEAEFKLKDLLQNKDYLAKLLELYGQQQVLPYAAAQKQGGGGGIFGQVLGSAAGALASKI